MDSKMKRKAILESRIKRVQREMSENEGAQDALLAAVEYVQKIKPYSPVLTDISKTLLYRVETLGNQWHTLFAERHTLTEKLHRA